MPRTLGERLREHWLAQGLTPRPGVSPADLNAFGTRHQVLLPQDFREYLSIVDGTGRYTEINESYHCWWSLSEMVSIAEEWPERKDYPDAATCFLFADHLIWAPVYAIHLNAAGTGTEVLAIWSDMGRFSAELVAPSFADLMEPYLRNEIIH